MPINPNIILGIQAPKFQMADPLESAQKSLVLQNLMGQQDMQGMQMRQAQMAEADDMATREAYKSGGGDISKVLTALQRQGNYKAAQALQDKILANDKARIGIDKDKAEILVKATAAHRDQLANVNDPQTAAQWVMAGYSDPYLKEVFARAGSPEQAIARIPQDPVAFQQWKQQNALGATKFIEMNKPTYQDIGGSILAVPGLGGAPQKFADKTNTPDAVMTDKRTREEGALNRGVTIRGQNLTDARAAQTLAAGKAPAGYRFAADGQSLEAIPGGPADGKADKLGEGAKKQITGIDALGSAIDDYTARLATWSRKDMASPSKRAEMGTLYNNVMLQAKEAYNLGVLNGPDYSILQAVVADPNNPKNILIAPEDLSKQATTLKSLMAKTRESVKNQGRGDGAPSAPITATNAAGQKIQLVNGVWQPVNK